LVALRRVDEIEQVVERYLGPNAAKDPTSANLMLYAGLHLHREGRVALAHALFVRALDVYSNERASGIAPEEILFGLARSLYYLERWGEARIIEISRALLQFLRTVGRRWCFSDRRRAARRLGGIAHSWPAATIERQPGDPAILRGARGRGPRGQ
jgi:hypothetical protein